MKLPSKIRALTFMGILFVLSVAPLSAQNSLPSPKDGSCWESLTALRACALEQHNRELDYEQRCTSYPEYQCAPEQSAPSPNVAKSIKKQKADKTAVAVTQPSPSESMNATATSLPPDAK